MNIKISPKKDYEELDRIDNQYKTFDDFIKDFMCLYSANASIIEHSKTIEIKELHEKCILNIDTKKIKSLRNFIYKLKEQGCSIEIKPIEKKKQLDIEILVFICEKTLFETKNLNLLNLLFSNFLTDTIIDSVPGETTIRIKAIAPCVGEYHRRDGGTIQ